MKRIGLVFCCVLITSSAQAADKPPTEDDYYKILRYRTAGEDEVLEIGALEFMPDGRLAVGTRRGEIWMVQNALADDPKKAKFTRFAQGLHEVLGLAAKGDWLYVTQRCDVSRIKDSNSDGKADVFEVVNDEWGISGDYHEYAFGSRFDKEGNIWVVLCLTGSFTSDSKFRGWCLRITPDGKMIPTCSGIRSPGGIGMNADGDMFYTDNQGPWNGTCELKHLVPGGFIGHPDSFKWYPLAKNMGPTPNGAQERQPIHDRGQAHSAVRSAGDPVPLRQDGPVRQRHRLRPVRRQVRPLREADLRRRSDAQHGHARLSGEGQRPLSGGVLPVPSAVSARATCRCASLRTAR